jgi:SSS family solute:Na+ symporter
MLIRYCGPGLLGLGITALVAGFMSGMAGNVSAFSTVWTYDIFGAYINKKASDKQLVSMGRWSTVVGMLISIGTAYLVANAASIMDYVQALFSFFIAPLFGTVILGMLWKRATKQGGFWGLLAGTVSSVVMFLYTNTGTAAHKAHALATIALSPDAQPMAENLYRALWSWLICVLVTVIVSMMTTPKTDAELNGLVYGATIIPDDGSVGLLQKPAFWACVVGGVFLGLNVIFW